MDFGVLSQRQSGPKLLVFHTQGGNFSMLEFTKSFFSYALAVSLFPVRQAQNMFSPQEGAGTGAAMAVANATADQLGETLGSAFRVFDNVQRGLVGLAF